MSNGNGNASRKAISEASIVQAIAELKEAVGLLWRRVDQSEVAANRESQKTQEKLDTWLKVNQSILESNQELVKAIVLNSQESRRSIESYERGSQLLSALSSQLQQFERVTKQLQATSTQSNASSNPSTSPSLQALSNQISVLQASIDLIQQTFDPNSIRAQLNDLQTIVTNTSQTIEGLGQTTSKIKSSVNEIKTNPTWNGKSAQVQWTPLILAIAIGGLCWFFGSKHGFNAGQLDVALKWFGGIENLDYWRQVRNLNKERADQCRQQGQTECPVRLP